MLKRMSPRAWSPSSRMSARPYRWRAVIVSPVSEENGLLAEGSGEGDVAVVVTNVEGSEASGGKASLALALHLKGESLVLQVVRQIKNPVFYIARGH